MTGASDVLRRQWQDSGDRLWRRLQGLTDPEEVWEPVTLVWTVRPHASESGRWEHAFGPGRRTFTDLVVPGSADDACGYWKDSREPISAWLDGVSDDDLDEMRPSHQDAPRT